MGDGAGRWPVDGGVRRLLSIKSETRADKGTVTGSVVFIGPDAFWIAVKPKDGPVDAYACSWPPGDVRNKLKARRKGDTVAIRFHADGQRYRIDSLGIGSEAPELPAIVLPAGVEAMFDVEYAKVADKGLRLDLYRPKDANGPLPLVVWIHGGAWVAGSKDAPHLALGLVSHGYVVASINYRLSFEAIFPAQIHDCKAAIRFLRANARKYSIDPDHIGVWGSSAGGHLAALVGTSGGVNVLEGNVGGNLDFSSRVQCAVDYFGPTDLLAFRGQQTTVGLDAPNSFLVRFVGGVVEEKNPLVAQANPIAYVSRDTPPVLRRPWGQG
ncbi:MAG TPA: alpha/beta hydrolase [Phycisphaerae bacterium]|nr:alpha/beta hydrolase [Planctomycetota bacterium]HUT59914.1 alpha/beta hydrolase [Phycisphaerae bacterium]